MGGFSRAMAATVEDSAQRLMERSLGGGRGLGGRAGKKIWAQTDSRFLRCGVLKLVLMGHFLPGNGGNRGGFDAAPA
jgi:hypothetical protein